jgi:hypothetical protein
MVGQALSAGGTEGDGSSEDENDFDVALAGIYKSMRKFDGKELIMGEKLNENDSMLMDGKVVSYRLMFWELTAGVFWSPKLTSPEPAPPYLCACAYKVRRPGRTCGTSEKRAYRRERDANSSEER